ncbi:CPBP family intramembrane glutamic endopeptidase [Phormidium sp. CCY1219]|uniref:CPBP family intramembrane glutamic endopeptidase n=1 Tax=Phormidium sp. CCY1219 TaxID=2886104 RepID=UPI002D1F5B90|nr:lysostaphin resistance A-like protein [Phormidium sp. CCY1219]MEB3826470.1 CPBP family intramembrane metalloprotease [Phormidium sp. CCY1219]
MELKKTVKRLVLGLLTVLVVLLVGTSLVQSFNQPQIQSRLELYQTNLFLRGSQYEPEGPQDPMAKAGAALLGEEPYKGAIAQYEQAIASTKQTLQRTRDRLDSTVVVAPPQPQFPTPPLVEGSQATRQQQQQLNAQIDKLQSLRDELRLQLGILSAQQAEVTRARQIWTQFTEVPNPNQQPIAKTARVLLGLWQDNPRVLRDADELIQANLDGWFRDRALEKLYRVQNRDRALAQLSAREQQIAEEALLKLTLISGLPGLGVLLGVALLLFVLAQRVLKGKESLLAQNGDRDWDAPWDWEMIWQVFVVGFFFVAQILVPLLIAAIGIKSATLAVRERAFYILFTYILLASGGLGVLFFSIKSFFPLGEEWFRIQWRDKWFLWGIGGYVAALPLVILVSLINQQIWQGRGGSNPILPIALSGQDNVALVIFFITASVAAPVFEEIMFRGFLLPSLTRYTSVWGAIAASSALFALAHLNLSEVLPLATLGVVLGVVYTRSRNLLAPILLHSLWNSGTLLSLFILGSGTN